jgi:hypothetical protein
MMLDESGLFTAVINSVYKNYFVVVYAQVCIRIQSPWMENGIVNGDRVLKCSLQQLLWHYIEAQARLGRDSKQ